MEPDLLSLNFNQSFSSSDTKGREKRVGARVSYHKKSNINCISKYLTVYKAIRYLAYIL